MWLALILVFHVCGQKCGLANAAATQIEAEKLWFNGIYLPSTQVDGEVSVGLGSRAKT